MNSKKIAAMLLAFVLICTSLASCTSSATSGKAPTTMQSTVEQVTDADDGITEEKPQSNTFDIVDVNGNTLTFVPVYNIDGKTVLAGYVQSAKDKNGKAFDENGFAFLKAVLAINTDANGNYAIGYNAKNEYIALKAFSDEKGYIITLQDSLDIDKDKDVNEYFKVESKLDNNNNLFIKLASDDKGKPINVTVTEDSNSKVAQVTDETGKTVKAKDTKKNKNLKDVAKKEAESKEATTTPSTTKPNQPTKPNQTTTKPVETTTKPAPEYTTIILKKNGQVESDGDNITISGSVADGGTEVKIDGPGKYNNKYYITSETDTFIGQLEFDLSVSDSVEVKLNDVAINTQRKTALKFVNVDSHEEKEADTETGTDKGQTGNDKITAAPKVELSFTGDNKIKAGGSGKNGALYSECKLDIKGHGTASIDGGDNLSGICTTESITIKNATLNIKSKAKQGISCDKKVTVNSGATINIDSMGDCIHCNKFEFDGAKTADEKESSITAKSMSNVNGKDGIDADNEIIIKGGKLNVEAMTPGKMAMKIRKIEDESDRGVFAIKGGSVISNGYLNTLPSESTQKTVFVTSAYKGDVVITVGSHKSVSGAKSFICSPSDVASVSSSSGATANVKWNANLGTVIIK